jgi:Outer membrane protein beta-barrel domain
MDTGSHLGVHFQKMFPLFASVVFVCLPGKYASAQSAPITRNESSVTLYGGGRFGGSVTDSTSNSSIDLKNGSSFGLSVDIGLDRSRQVELFYSQQDTALTSGAFLSQSGNAQLTLHNFHVGGTAFIDEIGRGLYVMGGIGGTTATPKGSGLNSETFLSGNLGVGWMVPLAKHVGFRFEARGYGVLLNGNGSLFCGGAAGCTVAVRGKGLFYGEVLGGVAVRF